MALRSMASSLRRVTRQLPSYLAQFGAIAIGEKLKTTPLHTFSPLPPPFYPMASLHSAAPHHQPPPTLKPGTKVKLPWRPKAFDMEKYLAQEKVQKPWHRILYDLGVAEQRGIFVHPADINRHAMGLIGELSQDVGSKHALFDRLLLQCARNGDESENPQGDGMRQLTVQDGLQVVNTMCNLGLRPTRIGLEALIDCCDAASEPEMAEEIVRRMEEEFGLPPTIITLVRLLRACVNAEDEDRALRVVDRLPREDLKSRDMQLFVMQTLLLQYEQAAEGRDAAEAPESMPRLRKKLDTLLQEIQDTNVGDIMLLIRKIVPGAEER